MVAWDYGSVMRNRVPTNPYFTKPRARVVYEPSLGDGTRKLIFGYLTGPPVSGDFSDSAGIECSEDDPYASTPVTIEWYPDSGATHHLCKDASALNNASPYSGTVSILMGDCTRARISLVGNSVVDMSTKVLHLSNVLHVPSIRKNLLSVSQFARENNVFFEFDQYHCLVNDIETQVVLM